MGDISDIIRLGLDPQAIATINQRLKILWIERGGASTSTGGTYTYNEVPAGAINGSNATFTTALQFVPNKVSLYINGLMQKLVDNYQTTGNNTILINDSPQVGDIIIVFYKQLTI